MHIDSVQEYARSMQRDDHPEPPRNKVPKCKTVLFCDPWSRRLIEVEGRRGQGREEESGGRKDGGEGRVRGRGERKEEGGKKRGSEGEMEGPKWTTKCRKLSIQVCSVCWEDNVVSLCTIPLYYNTNRAVS